MTTIFLPNNLNIRTIGGVFNALRRHFQLPGNKSVVLDLSRLRFVDTCGMTGLATIIVGFYQAEFDIIFQGLDSQSEGVRYLHSAGFISALTNYSNPDETIRTTTVMPFNRISGTNHVNYIHFNLKPWFTQEVSLSGDSLDSLCSCIAEAFMNVEHHGGEIGFGMAQHYPRKKEIHITVSDRGIGIPAQVRKVHQLMSDERCLVKAVERGFTTKTNYTNRGFGLDNLIRYTVGNNGGEISIRSLNASLVAKSLRTSALPLITTAREEWPFPGTLVHICLRTDTLERDPQPEEFRW